MAWLEVHWSYLGRNIHFGVREHAMGAITVGMALHGGFIPYTATFLTFADYMRPPMRLAALMGLRVIFIFTHDSIGVGEDGPTHQPVEQIMNMRQVPNLTVIRPADANEVVESWQLALSLKPTGRQCSSSAVRICRCWIVPSALRQQIPVAWRLYFMGICVPAGFNFDCYRFGSGSYTVCSA